MNCLNISEQNKSWQDARRGTCCMTSVVEYFDWLENSMAIKFLSSERTTVYLKVIWNFGETLI